MDPVRTARQHLLRDGTSCQDHHRRRRPDPFEGRGYATRHRPNDPAWRVAATLYLTTSDSRYSWLDGTLALWEGEFNEDTHHARYTAFIQPAAPAA
jgi:hypothetical protein